MPDIIRSGIGNGYLAGVRDDNRLLTHSVTQTAGQHSADEGDAYNINTGKISISAESAILYVKNNSSRHVHIEAIALGVGSGTTSNIGDMYLVRNPTTGDIITTASSVDMNQNRNFGSSNTLTVDAYKGASGDSFTNGDDVALFFQGTSGRLYAGIDMVLQSGSSVGVRYQPNLSSGSVSVYCALICREEDV